jgi:hypothetical protein
VCGTMRPRASMSRLSCHPSARSLVLCVAESEYFFWDVVFLMRRFFLCLCAVVFSGQPNAQAVCSFSASAAAAPLLLRR